MSTGNTTSPSPCSICDEIVRRAKIVHSEKLTHDVLHQLFHSHCGVCTQHSEHSQELCPFCTHLRLRHLSACYGLPLRLDADRGEVIENQERCAMCRVILRAATIHFEEPNIPRYIPLHFQPRKKMKADREGRQGSGWESVHYQMVDMQAALGLSILDCGTLPPETVKSIELAPLRRRVEDWSLIKAQLHRCVNHHTNCNAPHGKLPQHFRVIDVIDRRIVPLPPSHGFVALSYVWGINPKPSLHIATRSSIGSYEIAGGLSSEGMPRTIEDAMLVCTELGERYLWTDRLCIVQDDAEDKAEQIKAMSAIYSSALFVIVTLDGDHMEAGLAGISRDREDQLRENVDGLLVSPIPRDYLASYWSSVWYTRGWTYQEAVLSKRKLYFDTHQITFECEQMVWHEDRLSFGRNDFSKVGGETPEDGELGLLGGVLTPMFTLGLYGGRNGRFGEYVRHLIAYRRRSLTQQSDAYDAFAGILQALYGDEEVLYGIPMCNFDGGLLWRYSRGASLPPGVSAINQPKDMVVPTWSWASVVGGVSLRDEEFQGTLISWTIIVLDGGKLAGKAVEPYDEPPSWTSIPYRASNNKTSPRISMFLAWTEGCLETPRPKGVPSWKDATFLSLDSLLSSRWTTYGHFMKDAFGVRNVFKLPNSANLTVGTLCGRAQVASFRLVVLDITRPHRLGVIDEHGTEIGFVNEKEPRVNLEVYPRINDHTFTFIALSVAFHPDSDLVPSKELPYRDVEGQTLECSLAMSVLLVGRQGQYMYRVSSGRIHLRDWVKARPRHENIFLA